MGAKITIDSATLMNKGLELIEAAWLFGLPEDKIQIVVQRESIIHSAVQFADHSIIAQLGVPDMRIPIQYALTWPDRLPSPVPELDFTALTKLSIAQEMCIRDRTSGSPRLPPHWAIVPRTTWLSSTWSLTTPVPSMPLLRHTPPLKLYLPPRPLS